MAAKTVVVGDFMPWIVFREHLKTYRAVIPLFYSSSAILAQVVLQTKFPEQFSEAWEKELKEKKIPFSSGSVKHVIRYVFILGALFVLFNGKRASAHTTRYLLDSLNLSRMCSETSYDDYVFIWV